MCRPSPEPGLAALREQVRQAGEEVAEMRVECVVEAALGLLPVLFVILPPLAGLFVLPWDGGWAGNAERVQLLSALCGGVLVVSLAVYAGAAGAAALRRWRLGRGLRFVTAAMAREPCAAALLPLRADRCGDTRKIATRLLRDIELSTEVAPAPGSRGRGGEVAAEASPP